LRFFTSSIAACHGSTLLFPLGEEAATCAALDLPCLCETCATGNLVVKIIFFDVCGHAEGRWARCSPACDCMFSTRALAMLLFEAAMQHEDMCRSPIRTYLCFGSVLIASGR
jgi:hypothetical protein